MCGHHVCHPLVLCPRHHCGCGGPLHGGPDPQTWLVHYTSIIPIQYDDSRVRDLTAATSVCCVQVIVVHQAPVFVM